MAAAEPSATASTAAGKSAGALRTIGELSRDTGLPQHVLRYWESRFPQLRPIQRAGNRRYYRPEDVALVTRIAQLLNHDGYTVRGVQKLLASEKGEPIPPSAAGATADVATLRAIRDALVRALADDGV